MAALILSIDDEADICRLLDTILTLSGYRSVTAGTAAEALHRMALRPDMVILDVNLPDMDGIDLCRRLRRLDARVPILFLTAATGARRAEAMAAGGSAFLEKPFDVDGLLDLIGRLLVRGHERRSGRDRRRAPIAALEPERRLDERRDGRVGGLAGTASNPSIAGRHGRQPPVADGFPVAARVKSEARGPSSCGG